MKRGEESSVEVLWIGGKICYESRELEEELNALLNSLLYNPDCAIDAIRSVAGHRITEYQIKTGRLFNLECEDGDEDIHHTLAKRVVAYLTNDLLVDELKKHPYQPEEQ
jgi:hypothetical protein